MILSASCWSVRSSLPFLGLNFIGYDLHRADRQRRDRRADKQTDVLTDRQRQTSIWADREETDGQRQTGRWRRDRQADKEETDGQTEKRQTGR